MPTASDNPDSPYINSQCKADTHIKGEVIFSFEDAVELIENYHIDGRSLLELIDSLEDVEPE